METNKVHFLFKSIKYWIIIKYHASEIHVIMLKFNFFFTMYKYVLIKLHTKKFSEFVVSKVLKQLWWAFYSFIVYIYHIFSLSSFCLQPIHPSKIWKTSRGHMCGKPLITAHIIKFILNSFRFKDIASKD